MKKVILSLVVVSAFAIAACSSKKCTCKTTSTVAADVTYASSVSSSAAALTEESQCTSLNASFSKVDTKGSCTWS